VPEVPVSDADLAALEAAAETEERTLAEVVHAAVQDYTSGWRRERDQLLDHILELDAKLLRKLGTS
jgi:hypothetical protein